MKIGILGAGNLGSAIAKGLLKSSVKTEVIYLTRRNKKGFSTTLQTSEKVTVTTDNTMVIKHSDIVILAVQPKQLNGLLEEIGPWLDNKKHTVISVITGRSIEDIGEHIGSDYPIIRAMPNTAIAVGESMTCLTANEKGNQKMELARNIFSTIGQTMEIEENLMQAATVICASGIAFWMRLIRATTQGAIQLGFDAREAQLLSMQTCLGAARLLVSSGNHPEQEIDKVTTPSGCTIEGLNEMEHQGLSSSLIKGLVTSYERINLI